MNYVCIVCVCDTVLCVCWYLDPAPTGRYWYCSGLTGDAVWTRRHYLPAAVVAREPGD